MKVESSSGSGSRSGADSLRAGRIYPAADGELDSIERLTELGCLVVDGSIV